MGRPVVTRSADCVYATSGWGIHDDRWIAALEAVGYRPHAMSLGRDVGDVPHLQAAVTAAAAGGPPVLAGPLHSVTRHLVNLPISLVGLSWGYDFDVTSNSLDVYIGYLRRKTEIDDKPRLVQTVRGVGYVVRP